MRCLRRNKSTVYYALFDRSEAEEDEYGNITGEYTVVLGNPVKTRLNVSPARNQDVIQIFGTDINYDKVLVSDDPNTPINEHSVLWVDTMPELDSSGATETPYDYVVKKVARSLNSVSIAVSKVDVSV